MATGDTNDILARVKALIPRRWFAWVAPYRDAILGGLSDSAAWCYAWIVYARLQIRLRTATGPWLDVASRDFLGTILPRRSNEADTAFSARLIKEILRPRNTRAAISQMLLDLTGSAGTVQEPWNPRDWGGYGLGYSGYGQAIGYGSLQFNNQIFVVATRPSGNGIPNVAGYGTVAAGYGVGPIEYSDLSQIVAPLTDAEIYAHIAQTVSAGTTAWTDIVSASAQSNGELVFIGTQPLAMTAVLGFFW
jgi:hypothetical protein